jgi:acyl-CoA synthetase (AMP-forming)/AMP-acid ligase II
MSLLPGEALRTEAIGKGDAMIEGGLARISDCPAEIARRFPGREAAVLGDCRLTYAELAQAVDRCARALLTAGVGKGDRVAMLSTPRPEYLIVFLATIRIGAIWSGLNPVHQLDEVRTVVEDCRPRLLFAFARLRGRDNAALLTALRDGCPFIERLVTFDGRIRDDSATSYDAFMEAGAAVSHAAYAAAVDAVRPEDVAMIIHTSGSTGRPKGAMITHRNLAHCAAVQLRLLPVAPLRALCNLPVSHVACSSDIAAYALAGGGTLVFQERFDPAEVLALIARERVTWMLQVPAMFQRILAVPGRARFDTASLQVVLFEGAPMPRDMIAQLQALGGRVFTTWGLTEATCSVTYTGPDDDLDVLAETVGRVAPTYELRIADAEGRPVPDGETGEVLVRGACVMAGYYGRPAATATAIDAEGWLHSGDLGRLDADGRLRLVGRRRDMFKSGGYNIYPREIESVLEAHPAVALAAVVAVPDALYHEVGWAFVIRRPGAAPDAVALAAFCRERLANYKVPKRFVVRDALPMLAIGKIDKAALQAEALRLSAAEVT